MALRMPEIVSVWTAAPLYGFYWLMYPAIWILNHSANRLLRWTGLDPSHGTDAHYSADEIKLIMRRGHRARNCRATTGMWSPTPSTSAI